MAQSALTIERLALRRSPLIELLQQLGFRAVVSAFSTLDAFERMQLVVFDAVFVEVERLDDPGFDFVRDVRFGAEDFRRTPIIVVSSGSSRLMLSKARDCGASGFLVKPFSRASVAAQLARAVNDGRQFVATTGFAGPDRRRWKDPNYRGPERRATVRHTLLID
ncbi:MAG: response regulator [Hyphomonadaceae bacterium]